MKTDNAVVLQQFIEDNAAAPWYESTGILGLGLFGSFAATLILFLLIMYIIGGVNQYRKTKKWLIPNGRFWLEIGRGLSIAIKTWSGKPTPRIFKDSSDGKYANLSFGQIEDCMSWAYTQMRLLGVTYHQRYNWRVFDCEDFAFFLKAFATLRYRNAYAQDKAGAPFALFGYYKDGNKKKPHVCIKAFSDGKPVFYEVYPDPEYSGQLKITQKGIDSMNLQLF